MTAARRPRLAPSSEASFSFWPFLSPPTLNTEPAHSAPGARTERRFGARGSGQPLPASPSDMEAGGAFCFCRSTSCPPTEEPATRESMRDATQHSHKITENIWKYFTAALTSAGFSPPHPERYSLRASIWLLHIIAALNHKSLEPVPAAHTELCLGLGGLAAPPEEKQWEGRGGVRGRLPEESSFLL